MKAFEKDLTKDQSSHYYKKLRGGEAVWITLKAMILYKRFSKLEESSTKQYEAEHKVW